MQTGQGATEAMPVSPPTDEVAVADVRLALATILASQPFRTSKQCQNLLRSIVDHSLNHDDLALRERVLGVEVFGRAVDYDTSEDPVVRMRAADVRKRLAQFYQSIDDDATTVHIELKPGSYRAAFHMGRPAHATASGTERLPHPQPTAIERVPEEPLLQRAPLKEPRRLVPGRIFSKRKALSWMVLLAILPTAGLAAWSFGAGAWASPQRRFWAPLTASRKPILLYLGSNVAYRFNPEFQGPVPERAWPDGQWT